MSHVSEAASDAERLDAWLQRLEQSHPVAYAELLHFATKNNLNIFMKEGTIPHGHDSHLPVEEKKGWRVVKS